MCQPRLSLRAFRKPSQALDFKESLDHLLGEICQSLSRIDPATVESLIRELETTARVFGFGIGRSGYILRTFCMRLMHLGLTIYYVGETITPSIQPQDLLLVVSGSGETSQTYGVLRQAQARGARTIALTAHQASSISRQADLSILVPGTSKLSLAQELESVQCPGSLFEQATFLFLETVIMMLYQRRLGWSPRTMLARHADLE